MMRTTPWQVQFSLFLLVIFTAPLRIYAEEISVAVASNFSESIKNISKQYEKITDNTILLSFGSTGKHYAQIKNGAPFDIFFAADSRRPQLLEEQGLTIADSRFTYAIGKLVLWSGKENLVDPAGKVLSSKNFRHLAIANPKLAPYGMASQEVLQSRELWKNLQNRLVRGENISQTFQFVQSGNAELGFIAYSQIKRPDHEITGSYWIVPQHLYHPIEQQVVLLKRGKAAEHFLAFMQRESTKTILHQFGYETL